MLTHLHAEIPLWLSNPYDTPAAINPLKAPEIRDPEYRRAVRRASSLRVYHDERKNKHPGFAAVLETNIHLKNRGGSLTK